MEEKKNSLNQKKKMRNINVIWKKDGEEERKKENEVKMMSA